MMLGLWLFDGNWGGPVLHFVWPLFKKGTFLLWRSLWDRKEWGTEYLLLAPSSLWKSSPSNWVRRPWESGEESCCHSFLTRTGIFLTTTNIQTGASWEFTGTGRGSNNSSTGWLEYFINSPNAPKVIIMRILKASVEGGILSQHAYFIIMSNYQLHLLLKLL